MNPTRQGQSLSRWPLWSGELRREGVGGYRSLGHTWKGEEPVALETAKQRGKLPRRRSGDQSTAAG